MTGLMTMLDLAKMSGNDKAIGLIEENLQYAPELEKIPGRTIKGTAYKTLIRTSFPSVGFRKLNEGIPRSKSSFKNLLVECFLFGGRCEVDQGTLLASEDGADFVKATEASGVTQQAMLTIGSQLYYGDVKTGGFPGLASLVDAAMVFKNGGTTDNTATSVYGVKVGLQGVQFIFGGGDVMNLGPWRVETIRDDNNKPLPGEVADLIGWIGLQCVNKNAVGRLGNITDDANGKLSDGALATFLSKFPIGFVPDFWLMNRRARLQLQLSRATVNAVGAKTATGVENMPPVPTESNGVPIICTDSISNTEKLIP